MRFIRAALLFLAASALFALIYGQAPLYYSNQNQYFLHGLAAAGEGFLADDWLAQTRDPTPVFSGLVTITARWLHTWAFHIYYGLLLGAYTAAMLGLFVAVAGKERAARRWPIFVILFVLVHCAVGRWASYRWLGNDYPWYFQAGVAGQYILGAMFQPSTFGVLLVAAVYVFVRSRECLAGFFVALCATIHSTYLVAGALLTGGFLVALLVEGRRREALRMGAWTLALVLPVSIYVLVAFRPTTDEVFAVSQNIVANYRLPHHSRPEVWFDAIAALQTGWLVLAILLVLRTRLFWVLVVPAVLAALLTLLQLTAPSDSVALLFPWRISAVLVPIATAVILSRLSTLGNAQATLGQGRGHMWIFCAATALGLAGTGAWIMADRQGYHSNDDELAMMEYVRKNCRDGDVYLIPVRVSNLPSGIVVARSSDFEPWVKKKADPGVIPQEMQRFRLTTGAPIFVDFKSIPYRDIDVMEWLARVRIAEGIQNRLRNGAVTEAIALMRDNGLQRITHLVRPATEEYKHPELEEVFPGPGYRVYRLRE